MGYLDYNNFHQDDRTKIEYISESSVYCSTSGQLLELYSKVFSELQDTVNEWKSEISEDAKLISCSPQASEADKQHVVSELKRRIHNSCGSLVSVEKFLVLYSEKMKVDFLPAIAIDGDGEVVFEWYGRLGARAVLTFGENGAIYFVSLFHGEVFKYQLYINNAIPKEIAAQLDKIFIDKVL